ncbi:unnamed protein product [Moneuplotes crassus]|uniref:Uncharacterized protein n=1 Tax=Euplotes crassus TaxID=5936 RepID=A0AAD1UD07_EUPCR|nr:unnamed protein product [Moneuplotes crassus]
MFQKFWRDQYSGSQRSKKEIFTGLSKSNEKSVNQAQTNSASGAQSSVQDLISKGEVKMKEEPIMAKIRDKFSKNEESKNTSDPNTSDINALTYASHPYEQFQKVAGKNTEYLPQILNCEGIKTFILPKQYALRRFDIIQDHIDKEFNDRNMRNVLCETQFEYAKVHKCRRFGECLCRVFARDLLQLAYYKQIQNVHKYLERFFLKPQVYLPFQELLLWLQLEIGRRNYKQAEAIMNKYISYTTNLVNDETKNVVSLELKIQNGLKDRWKANPELLELYESHYFKLIDVYIFDILLPDRGYDQTKNVLLKEIAMEKSLKLKYLDKISDFYISSIRETSLMHGTKAIEQLDKASFKAKLKSRVDQIRKIDESQNEGREDQHLQNSLFQNTFNRQRFEQSKQSLEEPEKPAFLDILKQKTKVSPKTFIVIMAIVFAIWLWRGGHKKLRKFSTYKFILTHVFGIKSKK